MQRLIRFFRDDLWSPYTAGALLGLVAIAAMWGADHTVGASGAYQSLAAYVGLELTSTETTLAPAAPADVPAPAAADTPVSDDAAFWGAPAATAPDAAAAASETGDAAFWGSPASEAESAADSAGSGDAAFWGAPADAAPDAGAAVNETGDDAFWGSPSSGADSATRGASAEPDPASEPRAETITVARSGLEKQYTFFAFTSPRGVSWMAWLLVGIFLGALVSSVLSGGFKLSLMPHSPQWVEAFGPQVWRRWVLVFSGSVLLAVAAGIAGGCTSGLAIAQGVQLSPAAFLFIMGMFITGPLTALAVYRRRY